MLPKMIRFRDYTEEYKQDVRDRIADILAGYETEGGIHHLELARLVGIDRRTLTRYMLPLLRQGKVGRWKGLQGKYYLK